MKKKVEQISSELFTNFPSLSSTTKTDSLTVGEITSDLQPENSTTFIIKNTKTVNSITNLEIIKSEKRTTIDPTFLPTNTNTSMIRLTTNMSNLSDIYIRSTSSTSKFIPFGASSFILKVNTRPTDETNEIISKTTTLANIPTTTGSISTLIATVTTNATTNITTTLEPTISRKPEPSKIPTT
ncbi:hypothetical protein SNEBB_007261, partial [Seison nebaliae]